MHRRDFLVLSGLGLTGLAMPFGRVIAAEDLVTSLDIGIKKAMADAALQAARDAGCSYCDVRIGRYLSQGIITRERNVENVTNSESAGVGVRVIVDGAWGFAATHQRTPEQVVQAVVQVKVPVPFLDALPYILTVVVLAGFIGKAFGAHPVDHGKDLVDD